MLQRNFTLLLILSISLVSFAQKPKQEIGLLWKISDNGLEQPSYLFGTHHLAPLSFLDNIDGLNEAFESTQQTIGELDMSNASELQQQIMMAALMPKDYNYNELVSEDDYDILDKALKEHIGAGLVQFKQMKPAMLNTLLSVMIYKKLYPTAEENISMDEHFQKMAKVRNRTTLGLEGVKDQIKVLFDSQSIERQAESLLCSIKNIDYGKQQMDKLMTAYYAQDLTTMAKLFEEEDPNNPCPNTQEEKDELNKMRNDKWINKLPEMINEKSSFIAVGCLHLVGQDGLINMLRKQGYTVEAVNN